MSEWKIALIAGGSAILGSLVTGLFAWLAGYRQAKGAEAAGNAQANALLATVQATLDEQRRARAVEHRRQVYVQFLGVVEELLLTVPSGDEAAFVALAPRLATARGAIEIEGSREVARAAAAYMNALVERVGARGVPGPRVSDEVPNLRQAYFTAVRQALDET
ncbi:hypothetical protein [Streptomyces sp. NPDC058279]|uniref:hypothetical protein n=1 Tax=Streptomyces sp. NPDC058279 TaxID=3346418 RepID=UPI0036F09305